MSLERFSHNRPTNFRGMVEYFPKELQEGMSELTRRNEMNEEALIRSIRAQVVVDTSILNAMNSGEDTTSTALVMTSVDMDDSLKKSIMFGTF